MPQWGGKVGDKGGETEGSQIVVVGKEMVKEGNVLENLIHDLEILTPVLTTTCLR